MLINHTFDEENHLYLVPGRFVLGLSSIIQLNGLSDHAGIPFGALQRASRRGNGFDDLVQDHEGGIFPGNVPEDVMACFRGYLKFKKDHDVRIAGPMQCRMVWEHSTGILIGCTPDLVLYIDGELYNVDTKCTYPLFGVAKRKKHLAWRIQLQGQVEAWRENQFIGDPSPSQFMKKAILHCHPKLKNGYDLIKFKEDDSDLFESAIRMAVAKLEAGFEIERR